MCTNDPQCPSLTLALDHGPLTLALPLARTPGRLWLVAASAARLPAPLTHTPPRLRARSSPLLLRLAPRYAAQALAAETATGAGGSGGASSALLGALLGDATARMTARRVAQMRAKLLAYDALVRGQLSDAVPRCVGWHLMHRLQVRHRTSPSSAFGSVSARVLRGGSGGGGSARARQEHAARTLTRAP